MNAPPRLVLLLSFAVIAATASDIRLSSDVTTTTLPPPASPNPCNTWVSHRSLYANVTEGKRWEFGYPDFSEGKKLRVAGQSCLSDTKRRVRLGPFTSRPGGTYDITSSLVDSLFSDGDQILSFSALPVTAAGEPIGYPPMYVHHIHVGRVTNFYDEHWFTTHGDFCVGDDFGIGARSTEGYTTFLPDGYSFAVDCRWGLPLAVQAIVQDLRSNASSTTLSVFIEVNFALTPKAQVAQFKPATLVWNEAPHGVFGYSRFAVLNLPSMSWWAMRWPATGTLLPRARLHSHFARHHRLFVLDAAPQTLASFFDAHVEDVVHVHESVAPTSAHETMLLANLSFTERTIEALPSIICQDDDSMPSYLVAAPDEHSEPGRWGRRRDFVCKQLPLAKGRIATFVQLYRPVAEFDVRQYPMHTNTWFYFELPGETTASSDIKTVSYRYATTRTESLVEPLQDEVHGSCREAPSLAAVDEYVANNAKGLAVAVNAHRAAKSVDIYSVGGRRSRMIVPVVVPAGIVALGLVSVGVMLTRAADRARALM